MSFNHWLEQLGEEVVKRDDLVLIPCGDKWIIDHCASDFCLRVDPNQPETATVLQRTSDSIVECGEIDIQFKSWDIPIPTTLNMFIDTGILLMFPEGKGIPSSYRLTV